MYPGEKHMGGYQVLGRKFSLLTPNSVVKIFQDNRIGDNIIGVQYKIWEGQDRK